MVIIILGSFNTLCGFGFKMHALKINMNAHSPYEFIQGVSKSRLDGSINYA